MNKALKIKRGLCSIVCSLTVVVPSAFASMERPHYVGTDEPFAEKAVYFVVTDRFVDGDPSNNYEDQGGEYPTFNRPVLSESGQAVANIGYMGGDFAGIVKNAGYIAEMGFSAVWGTPIIDNPDQAFSGGLAIGEGFPTDKFKTGYHGYWGVNFYKLDEHLPSEGLQFAEFTSALDEYGLDFVLDIVGNHGSPSFDMPRDQPKFGEIYGADGNRIADHLNRSPDEISAAEAESGFFHNFPDIGQLSNFNENSPIVVEYLLNSYLYWLDQGADAIRIDTIKHVPNHFWKTITDGIRASYPDMFFFAEHWSHDAEAIAQHTKPENGGISVLDFPGQKAMQSVFGLDDQPMSDLLAYLHLEDGIYENPYELMTFYDNHDMSRMNAKDAGFINAHNWLFTSRGIPVVYYGSETGFRRGQGEHAGNRDYYGQDKVDWGVNHPIRRALIDIAQVRKRSVALQRGVQINDTFSTDTASFIRAYQDESVSELALVMLNKSAEARSVSLTVPHSCNYKEALTGREMTIERGGWSQRLEPNSVAVWLCSSPFAL